MQYPSDESYTRLISHNMTVPHRIKFNGNKSVIECNSGMNTEEFHSKGCHILVTATRMARDFKFLPMDILTFCNRNTIWTAMLQKYATACQGKQATGDIVDEDTLPNGLVSGWDYDNEKFDMKVPERILVVGQDQHLGTKAPPREIQLDNAVLPTDPGMIRVSTPPRVITLDQHYFPSADDFPAELANSPPRSVRPMRSLGDGARSRTPIPDQFNESTMTESRLVLRDPTPPMGNGEGLSASEELVHLRRQIVKLNRRVMAIEAEQLQRQQKEKIAYAISIAYILFKVIAWLNRS